MAEETKVVETTETNATENAPAIETVSKAEYEKLKASLDKALKEKGDITKQLRAKQSEDERIAEEQAEAQRIRDEEFEATKAELNRMKAQGAYKSISSEKVVENLIEAVSNADHNAIATIIDNEIKAAVKVAQTEWLKSRPQANVGSYSAMTKEQIMAITDRDERMRAIAQNQNLF
jgi:predicted nuclease with TOPRIM domain